MNLSATLAIIVLTSSSAAPELCSGLKNEIEPDMRILQSDLGQSGANEAADNLKRMVARSDVSGEFLYGALNQSKIVHGHILFRQAMADREDFGTNSIESRGSTRSFCTWLSTEGFWYD